jgi:hypothetical protein
MQPHVTTLALAGLLLCLLAVATSLAKLLTTTQEAPYGWLKLEPSSMHWQAGIGSILFSLVIFWIWLFVGSDNPDAEQEMQIAYWMAVVFALGGSYLVHYITMLRIQNTRWLDKKILRNDRKGNVCSYSMADFVSFKRNWKSEIDVCFLDGQVLSVDPYMKNADVFLGTVYHTAR